MTDLNQKNYDTVLSEANEYFKASGLNMLGQGFGEIASNNALFENYVDLLTEGASANDVANMGQLMANSRAELLRESAFSGIQAVASLSCPVIRKLWPKFAVKEAFETEVAKTPRFVIPYMAPYAYKSSDPDNKIYLARGLNDTKTGAYGTDAFYDKNGKDAMRKEFTAGHVIELENGAAKVIDFEYIGEDKTTKDPHVYIENTPSQIKKQALDELFFEAYIIGDRLQGDANANAFYVVWEGRFLQPGDANLGNDRDGLAIVQGKDLVAGDKAYELIDQVKIGKGLGVYDSQTYDFKGGQLLVKFDGKEAKATFAAIGGKILLTAYAAVCSEYNEEGWEFGFDLLRQDINIPTGQHINAPLPIEALQDMMALYQIDGTKETVDLMTNFFAKKVDEEAYKFIQTSFANQPTNEAYFRDLGQFGANEYLATFDCLTPAWFAAGPKAWREELKPVIDLLAAKIKNNTYLQNGSFNIVCNPIDAMLLANIDWQYRGGQGSNMDGVSVDYSVGTYVGANTYKIISTPNVEQGAMYINFLPDGGTQKTLTYYPYTYSTESGYIDPARSRVPSIMMTKRHTFHEFMPATACVLIKNNNANWFQQPYATYQQVQGQ